MDKQWYEYETDKEKIDSVYSKYTIKDFWDFWSDGQNRVMEVRIKDNFDLIKEISDKLKIPKSASGIYVKNDIELRQTIKEIRSKNSMAWYSINSKKKNWSTFNPEWKTFSGKDTNVESINFIFIDIDRCNTSKGLATIEDLKHCQELIDKILIKLNEFGFDKNYCLICSGNGLQLLLKLDFPIKLPDVEFNAEKKIFIENEEYLSYKELIRQGIGKQLLNYTNKFEEELQVKVDKSVFKLSVVGSLPFTFNIKNIGTRARGIIKIVNEGKNEGISDYCLQHFENIIQFKQNNIFKPNNKKINKIIKPGKLMEDVLVQFMLNTDLPTGLNNSIWMQMKCLLRDSNYDLQSKEFIEFHNLIKQKHKRDFSLNYPDNKFEYDVNVINKFCIDNFIVSPFKLWPQRNKFLNLINMKDFDYNDVKYTTNAIILKPETTLIEDLITGKELVKLNHNSSKKADMLLEFTKGILLKYGEEKTKYIIKILYDRWFNYE